MKKNIFYLSALVFLLSALKLNAQTSDRYKENYSQFKEVEDVYLSHVQSEEKGKQDEKILKNLSPELKAKLEEIKKINADKYYHFLRTLFPYGYMGTNYISREGYPLSSTENLKKEVELEVEAELLALKIKNSDGSIQQKLKNDLTGVLNQLFDIKENRKETEIKQLERRLQELKESLQTRKQNKNEIVQRRIQEILGNSRYYRWE